MIMESNTFFMSLYFTKQIPNNLHNKNTSTRQEHSIKYSNSEIITVAYTLYSKKLITYCKNRVSSREIAEDITQEAYTRTWLYLEKNKTIQHLKSFLYTTTRNLIIDEYRKHKTIPLSQLGDREQNPLEPKDFQTEFLRLSDGSNALNTISKLPKLYKQVLLLRYRDDLSVIKIAHTLHVTQNVASVRIYRGLRALRQRIK